MTYSVMLVDDELDNLQLLNRTLRRKYSTVSASSAFEAIELLKTNTVDLIISDHKMPGMDGVEFLKYVNDHYPDTIRILITAYTDPEILLDAINSGKIYRYIKKPWAPEQVVNAVESAVEKLRLNRENQTLVESFKDLFSGTIQAITNAIDSKDEYTQGRSKRVCLLSVMIAEKLNIDENEISKIELAGLLHDIGMIGVSEKILNKPETLTPEEYAAVKEHVLRGVKILEDIKQLESVIRIIQYHHEKYDGTGYPYGIKGEDIPIAARIIAVADAYDGMVSDRAYRKGMHHEKAISIIKESSGSQFDPKVVDVLLQIADSVKETLIQAQCTEVE